jgi:hypothetical protein
MKSRSGPVAAMVARMKPLPPRHRIAHLRTLIAREPAHTIRNEDLVELLREEMAAQLPGERRIRIVFKRGAIRHGTGQT